MIIFKFLGRVTHQIMSSRIHMQILTASSLLLILTIILNASLVTEQIHFKTKELFLSVQTIELDMMNATLSMDTSSPNPVQSLQHIHHALQKIDKLNQSIQKESWLSHSLNTIETQQTISSIQQSLNIVSIQFNLLETTKAENIIQAINNQNEFIQQQANQLKAIINTSIKHDFVRLSLFRVSVALLILLTIIGAYVFLRFVENRYNKHKEKEALLAAFPEENPNGVMFIDQQLSLTYSNPVGKKLFIPLELSLNQTIPKVWNGYCQRAKNNASGYSIQQSIDKKVYSLHFKSTANKNIHVYILDITDLHKSQRELQLLANIIEQTTDIVSIATSDGQFVYMNTAGRKLLGITPETDIKQHSMFDFHNEKESARIANDIIPKAMSQGTWNGEAMYIGANGDEIPASCVLLCSSNEKGEPTHFSIVSRSLREQKEIQAKLEHTQRLESLGVLAGGIAHDFNNILTIITGNTTLADSTFDDNHPARKYFSHITEASKKAAQLCNQMLAYSGKGQFIIEPINLSTTVNEISELMEVSLHKGVSIHYALDKNIPLIEADVSQLQQVIINLITNANDAMHKGNGHIYISTNSIYATQNDLNSIYTDSDLPEGEYVTLEVSDTGHGMDNNTINKIFEPFFTTKFTGHGLGMSAVLGIIKAHHGALHVDSKLKHGSHFKIFFPALCTQNNKTNPILPINHEVWVGNGAILVVDDDAIIRETSCDLLISMGFETCYEAADGIEAIEVYQQHQDYIQLVLLDMTMPRLDGKGALLKLRELNPNVNVILCSGYSEHDALNQLEQNSKVGFIQKPFSVQDLQSTIQNALTT